MKLNRLTNLMMAGLLAAGTISLTACAEEGTAEEAGEELDMMIEDAEDAAEETGDEMGDAIEEAGDDVEEATDNY